MKPNFLLSNRFKSYAPHCVRPPINLNRGIRTDPTVQAIKRHELPVVIGQGAYQHAPKDHDSGMWGFLAACLVCAFAASACFLGAWQMVQGVLSMMRGL